MTVWQTAILVYWAACIGGLVLLTIAAEPDKITIGDVCWFAIMCLFAWLIAPPMAIYYAADEGWFSKVIWRRKP